MFQVTRATHWCDSDGYQHDVVPEHISYHRTREGAQTKIDNLLASEKMAIDQAIAAETEQKEVFDQEVARMSEEERARYNPEHLVYYSSCLESLIANRNQIECNQAQISCGTNGEATYNGPLFGLVELEVLD